MELCFADTQTTELDFQATARRPGDGGGGLINFSARRFGELAGKVLVRFGGGGEGKSASPGQFSTLCGC